MSMELRLRRNDEHHYELQYGDIVLAASEELGELLPHAEKYAKKFSKKLFISESAVSDHYVGFPADRNQAPEIFFDPFFLLKKVEASESKYRFVEGPFQSEEKAAEAAFRISGKKAVMAEK